MHYLILDGIRVDMTWSYEITRTGINFTLIPNNGYLSETHMRKLIVSNKAIGMLTKGKKEVSLKQSNMSPNIWWLVYANS